MKLSHKDIKIKLALLSEEDDKNMVIIPKDVYMNNKDQINNNMDDDTVIKVVDEGESKANPWAICTASVGREDKAKYERCVMDVKKEHGISERLTEEEYNSNNSNVDVKDLKNDVQRFMDKLDLGQFKSILDKINTPMEQAEVIASFAERIGVPRAKLGSILKTMKMQAESVKPKMKKSNLIKEVLKNKK